MNEPGANQTKHFYRFGPFRLYVAERELFRGSEPVALPPKALDTLLVLADHRGHVVDKDELMKALWPDTFVEEASLVKQISQLRKVLGEGPEGKPYIETVARRGYRFVADVTESWEEEAAEPRLAVVGTRAGRSAAYPSRTSRAGWYVAGAVVAAALIAGAWLGLLGPAPTTAELKIVPFTTYPGSETNPAFSPNGDQVAFAWTGQNGDNTDIYVKLIGTTEPLRLTTDPARDVAPAWSPDGRTIAFQRHETGKQQVILIPALGGPERMLAEVNSGPSSRVSWSPDGEWLVTADRDSAADPYYLVLIGATSGEKRPLMDSRPGSFGDYEPAISPDGHRLAFTRADSTYVGYLFTVELSAKLTPRGAPKQLTWEAANIHSPAWTPDGEELVFETGDQFPRLWRIRIDTPGEAQRLVLVGEDGAQPAVARRGERLAYSKRSVDTNVWRLDLGGLDAGSSPARKLISSTRTDWNAAYSPDGERIAYQSNRATTDGEIWVCDQDGSNPIQLTSMGPGRSTRTPR